MLSVIDFGCNFDGSHPGSDLGLDGSVQSVRYFEEFLALRHHRAYQCCAPVFQFEFSSGIVWRRSHSSRRLILAKLGSSM